ncbi:hypothetical protein POL58_41380 [Nannocystis sp. ncelm1]|uniref:Uncharacterized protein n=1 Tax=Nannocystis radixulma TaxID=2995305 RepID=A0ABT5BLI3_9BACT|nr:hypothetical protein [Nannocystis radixulma]MDC0674273.1 hypothetical protein [Nannocystis radixulma]
MAKRDDLQPPPPAIDEEIRQPDEETAPGAVQVRRPGLGESSDVIEGLADSQLDASDVDRPEARGKAACLFGFALRLRMKADSFSQLKLARHATESE